MNWNSVLPDKDFQSGRPLPPIEDSDLCPYLRATLTDPNFQERPEPPRFDPCSRTFDPQLREYVQPRFIPAIHQPMQPPVPDNQLILMASMGHQPMQPPVPDNQPILMASIGQRVVESACYGRPEPSTFIHQPPAYEQPCFIPQQSEYNALGGQIGHSVSFPNNDPIPGCEPAIHLPVQPPVPDNQPDAILMMPIGQRVVESACYGRPEPPTFIHQPPAYEQPCFIPQQSEYNALGGQIGHSVSFPNNDPIPGCEPAIHLPVQPPVPDNQPDAILMMPIGQRVVESACYGRPEPPTFIHQPPAYEQPCFIPQQSEYNALGGQIGHSVSFPNNDPIPGCEPAIHLPVQPPVPDNQPDAILMMPIGQLVVESARYVTENYLRIVTGPLIFRVPEELLPVLIIPQPPPQQPQPFLNDFDVSCYKLF